ncbi:DUF6461 domain-containing protein, partial [Actinomadura adrarensis]
LGLSASDEQLVAVTEAGGDWALAVEANGYLGVTEDAIVPLSAGTRLVSHFCNVNALDRFCWVEDGEIRTTFEPLFPSHREGTAPDELLKPMRAAGFNLEGSNAENAPFSAFALAEHLTGVRVTAKLLRESHFQCGLAPIP